MYSFTDSLLTKKLSAWDIYVCVYVYMYMCLELYMVKPMQPVFWLVLGSVFGGNLVKR